jgi:hypothetical protein
MPLVFFAVTLSNIDHFELKLADQSLNNQGTNLCINCLPGLTCVIALLCKTQNGQFAGQYNSRVFQKHFTHKNFAVSNSNLTRFE